MDANEQFDNSVLSVFMNWFADLLLYENSTGELSSNKQKRTHFPYDLY